jgi:hypothetical protein
VKTRYSDYCTTFYDEDDNMVYFWDEMKDRGIDKQKVSGHIEALVIMQAWKDNAPEGVICEILD